jgi:hypothetical protein
MSGTAHRSRIESAWAGLPPGRRVEVTGWGLFAFVDVMTRVTVYESVGAAIALSLALAPLLFLLAAALRLAFDRLGLEGRVTLPVLPWLTGLSLAAAVVVVAAGFVLRTAFGLDIAAWSRGEAILMSLIYYFMIFTVWSVICFWMKAELARQAERERAVEAEANALRTELQRLRLQLDPHFLLNALNGIGEEIPENPDAAVAMLRDLATFLRQSLAGIDVTIVAVGTEAEALASYLRVQEARFGRRMTARLEVDVAAAARRIPSFLLQPLVENAIEHGRRASTLEVTVAIRAREDGIEAVVTNTGTLDPVSDTRGRTGIGLANVRRRLALHYPGRHDFRLWQQDGTVVARLALDGEPCSVP